MSSSISLEPFSQVFPFSTVKPSVTSSASAKMSSPTPNIASSIPTSLTGGGAGAGNQSTANESALLDELLWKALGSNAQTMTFWSCMGLVLVSLITSSTWTMFIQYLELYFKKDHWILRVYVCVGTLAATLCLALNIAQTYELIQHAAADYVSIFKFDTLSNCSDSLMVTIFGATAYVFYIWRIYKLSGSAILAGFLLSLNFTPFVLTWILWTKSLGMPALSIDNLLAITNYFETLTKWDKVAAAMGMVNDGCVCVSMISCLYFKKRNFFNMEQSLFRRLSSLAFESMIPPAIIMFILCSSLGSSGASFADWRRMFLYVLPVSYFHNLLFSLNARQSVRQILDHKLASEGVGIAPGGSLSSQHGFDKLQSTENLGGGLHERYPPVVYVSSVVSKEISPAFEWDQHQSVNRDPAWSSEGKV